MCDTTGGLQGLVNEGKAPCGEDDDDDSRDFKEALRSRHGTAPDAAILPFRLAASPVILMRSDRPADSG